MLRKIVIYSLWIFVSLLLLLSFLLLIAVRLSDKGDIVDRNSGWILLVFLTVLGIFSYSVFISTDLSKHIYRNKTADELINEIKKANLNRIDQEDKTNKNR